jgi:hypothetical protein
VLGGRACNPDTSPSAKQLVRQDFVLLIFVCMNRILVLEHHHTPNAVIGDKIKNGLDKSYVHMTGSDDAIARVQRVYDNSDKHLHFSK